MKTTTTRDTRHYHAYSVTTLGLNRKEYRQIIGAVYVSASLDCVKRQLYQFACGFAGCGVIVRSLRRTPAGIVAVCKFVKPWDARRLTVDGWKLLAA